MNEPELEKELRTLRPIAPTAKLAERIAAELAAPAHRAPTAGVLVRPAASNPIARWMRGLGWAVAGAAAVLAVVWFFQRELAPVPSPSPAVASVEEDAGDFLPAESERELVEADDSGILYVEGEGPVREMRFLTVERYAWVHPETGARVAVEVPREDVVLMPVAMQ